MEKIPSPENGDLNKKIVAAVLADLTGRRGFRQEFDGIDDEVAGELNATLERIVNGVLMDTAVQNTEKAKTIIEKMWDDLSDRRGLRQGFFDQLRTEEKRAIKLRLIEIALSQLESK